MKISVRTHNQTPPRRELRNSIEKDLVDAPCLRYGIPSFSNTFQKTFDPTFDRCSAWKAPQSRGAASDNNAVRGWFGQRELHQHFVGAQRSLDILQRQCRP